MGSAQTAGKALQQAFEALREETSIFARLTSTEVRFSQTTNILNDLWFRQTQDAKGNPLAQLELREFKNGEPNRRIVGDGISRWTYDLLRKEYSVSRYGNESAYDAAKYLPGLLQKFSSSLQGTQSAMGRLLKDVYGGDTVRVSDWLPNATPELLVYATADPVNPLRTYVPTETDAYILLARPGVRNRSYCFHLAETPSGTWAVKQIFFAESYKDQLAVDWTMDIYTGAIPADANFVFTPPASARPIVAEGGTR